MSNGKRRQWHSYSAKAKSLIIIGTGILLLSLVFFLIPYLVTTQTWLWTFNQKTGEIGDSIGGIIGPIVGFLGVIFTFLAFYIQFDANQVQREALYGEQFEGKFFELLRMHRENVDRIKSDNASGSECLRNFATILTTTYKKVTDNDPGSLLKEHIVLEICFNYFYLGINEVSKIQVKDSIKANINKDADFESLHRQITLALEGLRKSSKPLLVGQSDTLEVYFAGLYQLVHFVHINKENLRMEQLAFFKQIVRSQITSNEKVILFFCIASPSGKFWMSPEDLIFEFELLSGLSGENVCGVSIEKTLEIIRRKK